MAVINVEWGVQECCLLGRAFKRIRADDGRISTRRHTPEIRWLDLSEIDAQATKGLPTGFKRGYLLALARIKRNARMRRPEFSFTVVQ